MLLIILEDFVTQVDFKKAHFYKCVIIEDATQLKINHELQQFLEDKLFKVQLMQLMGRHTIHR